MRFLKLAVLGILLIAATSFAQRQFFVSTTEQVPVYLNQMRQMNERALETLARGTTVRVIDDRGSHYRVRTDAGNEGWIEKRLTVRSDSRRAFTFDDVEVHGYLDNPTPIFITDVEGDAGVTIELDRSFSDVLRRSTDKEAHSRAVR